jgi:hypothetical protein
MDRQPNTVELSRRTFLATTSAALVGAAWHGLVPQPEAAQRHPQRGGVLQFGTQEPECAPTTGVVIAPSHFITTGHKVVLAHFS